MATVDQPTPEWCLRRLNWYAIELATVNAERDRLRAELKAMPNYILRQIDPALWDKVKARAEHEGRPLKFVILTLLAEYVKHGLRQDK